MHPARFGELKREILTEESAIYSELLPRFHDTKLSQVLIEIDRYRGCKQGYSLTLVRELLARKCFSFPLNKLFYTLKACDIVTSAHSEVML
ncbi:MAG: TnsA endonuclease C-terminal domain-containing protein [Alteromonas stellipolaris]